MELKGLSIPELVAMKKQIDTQIQKIALEEMDRKENELNDLRELAGMKRKALTSAISKGRAKGKKPSGN